MPQKSLSNKVIVLCGGRGSRMGEATKDKPKPLVPVLGKPMLYHILKKLKGQGFQDFLLASGYMSHCIEEFANKYHSEFPGLLVSDIGQDASMLERICNASTDIAESALVVYGDTFIDIDFRDFLNAHEIGDNIATLVTGKITNPFGILNIDGRSKILSFREKPIFDYYIGSFLLSRPFLNLCTMDQINLPDGKGLVNIFQLLIEQNKLGSYAFDGLQISFNTQNERNQADEVLQDYYTINT